jgi:hypothetical protein
MLNGPPLEAGDGITGGSSLELAGTTPAQAILFDLR